MRRGLLAATFVLCGCDVDTPQLRTEDEIRDIAYDAADDVADARVATLERRVSELESELKRIDEREERMTEATASDLESANKRITVLADHYKQHVH